MKPYCFPPLPLVVLFSLLVRPSEIIFSPQLTVYMQSRLKKAHPQPLSAPSSTHLQRSFYLLNQSPKSQICHSALISLPRMEDYHDFDVVATGVPYGDGGRYKKGLKLGTCHLAPDQRRFKQKMFPYASIVQVFKSCGWALPYHHILVDCK